jgi:hypothetical protein
VEAGREIEDFVQDTMKMHHKSSFSRSKPRGLHQVCFIQSFKGTSWRKGFKSIIWVTLKINGVENVFHCVARKPFVRIRFITGIGLIFVKSCGVCNFCSWYKKEVVHASRLLRKNVIGE